MESLTSLDNDPKVSEAVKGTSTSYETLKIVLHLKFRLFFFFFYETSLGMPVWDTKYFPWLHACINRASKSQFEPQTMGLYILDSLHFYCSVCSTMLNQTGVRIKA